MRPKSAELLFFTLLLAFAAEGATISTSGYLDPQATDPSLPAWAQRLGFDLGPPQSFPSEHTNVVLVDFTVNTGGSLTIESFGYAGTGTGIDPYVTLYSGSTAALAATAFVLEHSPGGDFTLLTNPVPAGDYVLAISAWSNYGCPFGLAGCTLADGFSGLANLPFDHDTFFDIRITGDDIKAGSANPVQPVPEPATVLLTAFPIAAAACRRWWTNRV